MSIQPAPAPAPPGTLFVRWGLRGGGLSAVVPLMLGMLVNDHPGIMTVAVLSVGAAAGAAINVIVAMLLRRGKSALGPVESDLRRARSMMEQRLISEDEYLELKRQILANYQPSPPPAPNLWVRAYWGAVLGMIGCGVIGIATGNTFLAVLLVSGVAGVVGGVVTGGTAQIVRLALGAPDTRSLPSPNHDLPLPDKIRQHSK